MKKNLKNKKVYIIGCSNMGAYIASEMSNEGNDVLIIDKNEESFKKLHNDFSGFKSTGDATNLKFLDEIGIKEASIALVVTDNDNLNSYIAQYLDKIVKVPLVIARIYDTDKEVLLKDTNVKIIYPSVLTANEFFNICDEENKEEK